jgi:hypothetical protein
MTFMAYFQYFSTLLALHIIAPVKSESHPENSGSLGISVIYRQM